MIRSCLFHVVPIILVWSSISSSPVASSTNNTDRLALFSFKDQITENSIGVLRSWNSSIHYCEWQGITCSRRHRHRVTVLDLKSQNLQGTLSPYIGNLSFLKELSLDNNSFHGPIPQEIGRQFRLQVLSLRNNSFDGVIPTNLTRCFNLRRIDLTLNKLSGGIPVELTSLPKLSVLQLTKNPLHGGIPPSLGNLSSLTQLFLYDCNLKGKIPDDLCRIRGFEGFSVPLNYLTGMIPTCLYNLSQIWLFSVTENQLHGSLPLDIGLTLPNLEQFYMARNKLKGIIPSSLLNVSRLQVIELGKNQFTGQVPTDLGRLQLLQILNLNSNQLGGNLNFITSLTNCTNLKKLLVNNNSLQGSIPNSIANLSTQLQSLSVGTNQLSGSIPAGIENFVNLTDLDFKKNYLTGGISKVIGVFPKMYELYLDENQFSGNIPDSFSNSTQLSILNLAGNLLHGTIPTSLGDCKNLLELDLSNNYLNGTIPKTVIGLSTLKVLLNLSHNSLSGSLPSEVGGLDSLQELDISSNKLSGDIPQTLGRCLTLEYLRMDDNFFEGEIPQLSSLKGLKHLDLSRNRLSGSIPEYLGNFTALTYLNLSYNELEGSVPEGGVFKNANFVSVVGNRKLCGGVTGFKLLPCHSQTIKKRQSHGLKIVIPVIVTSLCLVLLSCLLFMCFRRRRILSNADPSSSWLINRQSIINISYAELVRATNNFSADNLVGVGSYGSVYKGILDQLDSVIAVKVFNLQRRGASTSFLSECNALGKIRHRNLLKIITSCSSLDFQGNEFKALIFEFMPKGNLDEWLHPIRNNAHELGKLNFLQRLNISIDVASAVDYLHHYCKPPIVHCDIKPSNVLLDDDMIAHVADFGLAKIFSASSSDPVQSRDNSLAIKGSIGYVPPEYGMGSEVSMKGDVYSYGILLLEMFTNKRPTEPMFQNGLSLHTFAERALPQHVTDIVDPDMLLEERQKAINVENKSNRRGTMQECLVSVIRLGITCSAESPIYRMDMDKVVTELCHIKDHYEGLWIHRGYAVVSLNEAYRDISLEGDALSSCVG